MDSRCTPVRFFDPSHEYSLYKKDFDEAFQKVMSSNNLILGSEVKKLENHLAKIQGCPDAVGVNSGTDALYLCLKALEIGRGDEVITVANTAVPTVSAIRLAGATPVFADISESNLLMNIDHCESLITSRTKAVVAVHLYGSMLDMDRLSTICNKHNIHLIEDCAQAQFSKWNNNLSGSFGIAASFSFYPTKNLGAFGDGGLAISKNKNICDKMRRLRMYGFNNDQIAHEDGINSRLDEMQAAFLNLKLKCQTENLDARKKLASVYNRVFADNPQITVPKIHPKVEHTYHLYVVLVENRDRIREDLKKHDIATGIHYQNPIHLMEAFKDLNYSKGSLPVTEKACTLYLSLPCHPYLELEQVNYVAQTLTELTNYGR